MPAITGIQRRAPNEQSSRSFSDYDTFVESTDFIIRRHNDDQGEVIVSIFFPRLGTPEQGVGLSFPSGEIATAVGRALLTVGEGCMEEIKGRF